MRPPAGTEPEEPAAAARPTLVESVIDALPTWTIVALLITALYLTWATLDILTEYVGPLPGVSP
jgi:hypothetical protein